MPPPREDPSPDSAGCLMAPVTSAPSTAVSMSKRTAALATVCALGVLFNIWVVVVNHSRRGVDFAEFYAAGEAVGSGHLYDLPVIEAHERAYVTTVGPFVRLPIVALAFKPFTFLSFSVALGLWRGLEILAGVLSVWLWPGRSRAAILACLCWSLPAAMVLYYGQDVLFWLFFFSLGLHLMDSERPYLAGISFALCISKFHLLLGLAVMLIAQRRWRTIAAGGTTGLILLACSFGLEGPRWPALFAEISALPVFTPVPEKMPNLYGLVYRLPAPAFFEILVCLIFACGLWVASKRAPLSLTGALAAAAGLLFAHHAYGYDCVLLLPLGAFLMQDVRFNIPLRLCALLIVSPLLLFLLASPYSVAAQIAVISLVAGAFWAVSVYRGPAADFAHTTDISSE